MIPVLELSISEEEKINKVLKELNIDKSPNVVLIDAKPKVSASKADDSK